MKEEIGFYQPMTVKKGECETNLPIKEGDIYWEVVVGKEEFFDCKDQTTAEIMSRLARIENILKKKLK